MSNYENNIGGKARSYMRGPRGKAFTYEDFTPEQLAALKGKDGNDGVNGKDGADGFSPTVAVADISGGHRVTIVDAKGTKTFDVMDGKTPVKGTDYFTTADKAEIAQAAAGQVTPAGIGAVKKSGDTMTGTLNVNIGGNIGRFGVDNTNDYAYMQYAKSDGTAANITLNPTRARYARKVAANGSWASYDILHTGNSNRSKLIDDDSLPTTDDEIFWRYK